LINRLGLETDTEIDNSARGAKPDVEEYFGQMGGARIRQSLEPRTYIFVTRLSTWGAVQESRNTSRTTTIVDPSPLRLSVHWMAAFLMPFFVLLSSRQTPLECSQRLFAKGLAPHSWRFLILSSSYVHGDNGDPTSVSLT
jgi:hypothetical protein